MKNEYKTGNAVLVIEEGQEAEIIRVLADGDLEVRFSDGEEGVYNISEVEV